MLTKAIAHKEVAFKLSRLPWPYTEAHAAEWLSTPKGADEVTLLIPRILDVLNGYLRAVEVSELGDPNALVRLRSQMLRRIQIVTGEGRVRDLLVTEFVLN